MQVIEVTPETTDIVETADKSYRVFLAGTIDLGKSDNWQKQYVSEMQIMAYNVNCMDKYNTDIINNNNTTVYIYNPRRIVPPSDVYKQIEWELEHLDKADLIYMNILGNSLSPITLMELGLYATSGKLKVTCPKEFYRYENVKMVCEKYKVPYRNYESEPYKEY